MSINQNNGGYHQSLHNPTVVTVENTITDAHVYETVVDKSYPQVLVRNGNNNVLRHAVKVRDKWGYSFCGKWTKFIEVERTASVDGRGPMMIFKGDTKSVKI